MRVIRAVLIAGAIIGWSGIASAQIPVLNSNAGAAYTVYLDYGGFTFTGNWGTGSSLTPGTTQPYSVDGSSTFSATEITNMREMWSRTAEKFAIFNVNVTTVDPAAAGSTDLQRQNFYDSQAKMMHTVVGTPASTWTGGGGISYIGVTQDAWSNSNGYHTNFVFVNMLGGGSALKNISEASGHENGHGLNLNHQSLYNGTTKTQEYDPGDANRAPIMGNSYGSARGLWRVGTNSQSSTTIQNDIGLMMTNAGFSYVDSGKGHTRAVATPLPLNGTSIDFTQAKGVITPINTTNPNPLGESNYTTDYYQIVVGPGGANVSVTLRSGRSTLNPGVADPGAMLDATLRLLDSNGNQLQISNSSTFLESITANNLAEGTYYFQITSAGADASYFDVGSYFLTGSFVPVPEPTTVLAVATAGLGLGGLIRRRWRGQVA